jgi:GTP-binding protein
VDNVWDLMVELNASDEQLDFQVSWARQWLVSVGPVTHPPASSQVVFASALNGIAGKEHTELAPDMQPLVSRGARSSPAPTCQLLVLHGRRLCGVQFDAILTLPPPQVRSGKDGSALQLQVANIDYDSYKGKMGIGRIRSGKLKRVSQCTPRVLLMISWVADGRPAARACSFRQLNSGPERGAVQAGGCGASGQGGGALRVRQPGPRRRG